MIQVNEVEISESAVFAETQYHPAETKEEAINSAARTLIIAELLKQRALALGLEPAADDAKSSEDDYLEKLIEAEVYIPTASDDACRQYFDNNPQRFTTSPLLEVRHILLAAGPEDDVARVESKQLAEELLKRVQAGENISELAAKHSRCPSSQTGGSLGQISRGQTVPEFERQVFTANEGLMPSPVESRYGFHIVMVDRHIAGKPLPYEAVQRKIAEYLGEKVRRKAVAQYIETLISDAEIQGYHFDVSDSPLMQ
ncbi:MAG: peptidylprolyl isomerase [Idiomarina sp.]|nr:peptidylprolyl isomerase [Idiomarina sp.]